MVTMTKMGVITDLEEPWKYRGSFSIELGPRANTAIIPKIATVSGNPFTIKITNGTIHEVSTGKQFYADGDKDPFFYGNHDIKVIRDGKGNLLWKNKGNELYF